MSKAEIELLNKRELRGTGLFAALKHMETCEKCRSQIELPTREEILKRFEEDKSSSVSSETASVQKK